MYRSWGAAGWFILMVQGDSVGIKGMEMALCGYNCTDPKSALMKGKLFGTSKSQIGRAG